MTSADPDRPAKPESIAQLRAVAQPPEVRSRRNAEHWVASLYLRDLSPYLTWVLLRTRISANGVTGIMILTGWFTAGMLLIPGIWGALLGLIFGQVQMLVDCCDGEVARWRGTSSPAGTFLDSVGHYSTETLIALAIGIRAAGYPFEAPEDFLWTTLGSLLAIIIILNKALNDMVRVARAAYGAPKLTYSQSESAPRPGVLNMARRVARFLPFHRIFHSVELTMVVFIAAILGLFFGEIETMRTVLIVLVVTGVVTLAGHFVAILTSSRLRA